MIRSYQNGDAKEISEIYNHYVLHSTATFETIAVSVEEMELRIEAIIKKYPFIVALEGNMIVAYSYASQWKTRQAYDLTVESSIYVHPDFHGKGIGRELYTQLISLLEKSDIHAVLAGISLPNETSINLHESLGFKANGVLREVGWKFGKWIDVGYWNLLF
jgi:phosphinothricin acetyltransferase